MYKKMNIDKIRSDQEQLNDGGIDIDQLFEQIQTEIDAVDSDRDKSNNIQQIDQLGISFNNLDQLAAQVQITVEQQRIANKLREQFEHLKDNDSDLKQLRSQITKQTNNPQDGLPVVETDQRFKNSQYVVNRGASAEIVNNMKNRKGFSFAKTGDKILSRLS